MKNADLIEKTITNLGEKRSYFWELCSNKQSVRSFNENQ